MFSALFDKEWVKTKRIILLLAMLLFAVIIYALINTGQTFRISGAVQTWASMVIKDIPVLPGVVKWFPLLVGILLALVQFIPEMTDKRFKLTLHLPMPETKILASMLTFGTMVSIIFFLFMYFALFIGLSFYYPCEIIKVMTWQILPSLIAGVVCYFFTAWICLEPIWKQRIFNTLIAIGGIALFCIEAYSGAYCTFILFLILITIAGFIFPFYSAARFKDGAQS